MTFSEDSWRKWGEQFGWELEMFMFDGSLVKFSTGDCNNIEVHWTERAAIDAWIAQVREEAQMS